MKSERHTPYVKRFIQMSYRVRSEMRRFVAETFLSWEGLREGEVLGGLRNEM